MTRPGRFRRRNRDAKLALLASVPLFAACTKGDLNWIAALADQLEVEQGRVLTRQGDTGWECFVIVEGKAKATMRGKGTAKLGPGDFFGEMSLLDRGPRSATVTAGTDMQLLVVGSREFSSLVAEVPSVARKIMAGLAQRLRDAERTQPQH